MTCNKITTAFYLLFVLCSGPVLAQVSCPEGFSAVDGKCFSFVLETMTWADAETNCEALGGYLAILDECRLWTDVVKMINAQGMSSYSFWIGATDVVEEGVWLWLSGANVEMGIPFWGWDDEYPEPDGGDASNCAALSAADRHYFYDFSCTSSTSSICQIASLEELQTEEQ